MKNKLILFSIAMLAYKTCCSQGLSIGQPGPSLKFGCSIKGRPANNFEKGKIYVLEFWATWCGPCKQAMPHISILSKKYKNNVEFIGISVWENDTKEVSKFVRQLGERIDYPIAIDMQESDTAQKGYMTETYLKPLGIRAIPATIVIGKTGLIEWIGSPFDLDYVLPRLISDTWSIGLQLKQKTAEKSLDSIKTKNNTNPNWISLENNLKKNYPYLSSDSIIMSWQYEFYNDNKDYKKYTKTLTEFINKYDPKVNPNYLNSAAWAIFNLSYDERELSSAAKWLEHDWASNDPAILDTYANLMYKLGKRDIALPVQAKALNLIVSEGLEKNFAITYYKMLIGEPTWKVVENIPYFSNSASDWSTVAKSLASHNSFRQDSIVHISKLEYMRKANKVNDILNEILEFNNKYTLKLDGMWLNQNAWYTFLFASEVDRLNNALSWSKKSLIDPKYKDVRYSFYDTYANILYKLGHTSEAKLAMQKAVDLSPINDKAKYVETLRKIQKGEITWNIDNK